MVSCEQASVSQGGSTIVSKDTDGDIKGYQHLHQHQHIGHRDATQQIQRTVGKKADGSKGETIAYDSENEGFQKRKDGAMGRYVKQNVNAEGETVTTQQSGGRTNVKTKLSTGTLNVNIQKHKSASGMVQAIDRESKHATEQFHQVSTF